MSVVVDPPSRGLLAPALLGGVAVLALALQVVSPSTRPTIGSGDPHPVGPAGAMVAPVVQNAPADYPAIARRPLFSPGAPRGGAAAAGAFTLLGVAAATGRASAVIRATDGLHTLRLGETLEGWRLVAIGGDRATLRREGRVQALRIGALAAVVR